MLLFFIFSVISVNQLYYTTFEVNFQAILELLYDEANLSWLLTITQLHH
nr:MAG TPA: hypothetical protein [Ackermannviridae sp.]